MRTISEVLIPQKMHKTTQNQEKAKQTSTNKNKSEEQSKQKTQQLENKDSAEDSEKKMAAQC